MLVGTRPRVLLGTPALRLLAATARRDWLATDLLAATNLLTALHDLLVTTTAT